MTKNNSKSGSVLNSGMASAKLGADVIIAPSSVGQHGSRQLRVVRIVCVRHWQQWNNHLCQQALF